MCSVDLIDYYYHMCHSVITVQNQPTLGFAGV